NRLKDAIEVFRFERCDRLRGCRIRIEHFDAAEREGTRREVSEMQLVRQIGSAGARECARLKWHPHLKLRRRETRRNASASGLCTCAGCTYKGNPEDYRDQRRLMVMSPQGTLRGEKESLQCPSSVLGTRIAAASTDRGTQRDRVQFKRCAQECTMGFVALWGRCRLSWLDAGFGLILVEEPMEVTSAPLRTGWESPGMRWISGLLLGGITLLVLGLASAKGPSPRTCRWWVFSEAHVGTDKAQGRDSLATALRQSESASGFEWDVALDLGDMSGMQDTPQDAEGQEIVRQFSVLTRHRREQIYDLSGNHDSRGLNEPQAWGGREWQSG